MVTTFLVILMTLMLSKCYKIIHKIVYLIINFFFVILVANLMVTATTVVIVSLVKTTAKAAMETHIRKFFLVSKYI